MYWMDERLKHSDGCKDTLPKELAPLPFSSDEAAIFPYKLVKDPDDLKKIWRPDVFIDQAIEVRWRLKIS